VLGAPKAPPFPAEFSGSESPRAGGAGEPEGSIRGVSWLLGVVCAPGWEGFEWIREEGADLVRFAVVCAMRKLFFSESACKETKLHSAPHSWLPLERGNLSKSSAHASGGTSM